MNLFSPCVFGHASDPLIVLIKGVTHWEGRRCHQDLGIVLAGQKYRARRVKKPKKQPSAEVLRLTRKQA